MVYSRSRFINLSSAARVVQRRWRARRQARANKVGYRTIQTRAAIRFLRGTGVPVRRVMQYLPRQFPRIRIAREARIRQARNIRDRIRRRMQ